MSTSTCPECGTTYRAKSGGHCRGGAYGGCCRTYSSDSAAAAHIRGPASDRSCASMDDDHDTKGNPIAWRQNHYGEWTNEPPRPVTTWA